MACNVAITTAIRRDGFPSSDVSLATATALV